MGEVDHRLPGQTVQETIWRRGFQDAVFDHENILARALGEAAPVLLIGAKQSGFSGGDWGDLTGPFTALPMLITDWSGRPAALWNGPTQAAILVTLVVVLGINTVGIMLRNRFDKKN